jgi:hypothetical protein
MFIKTDQTVHNGLVLASTWLSIASGRGEVHQAARLEIGHDLLPNILRVLAVAITSSQSRPPQYLDLKFTHEL